MASGAHSQTLSREPTPETMGKVREASVLGGFLPYIEVELAKMLALVDTKAFAELEQGRMTPERAMELWMEKKVLWRMGKRFRSKVAIGQTAGKAVSQSL